MSLIVAKNIRNLFKKKGLKTSEPAISALNKEVKKLCLKTADNVLANKAKVIKQDHVPELDPLLDSSLDDI